MNLFRKYNNLANFDGDTRNMISLKSQCPCMSPFGSNRELRSRIAARKTFSLDLVIVYEHRLRLVSI
ncbi:hypothetical protein NQ317_011277 [Molorchus minor]|uniref:Uncharacterized protein n=1 Tax=Molorchus minor TaxID=1323400 RepID=A0ABQ9JSC2_9CUCU|nr:hypothetical protein NQ317_011277 [Molorchus minor]